MSARSGASVPRASVRLQAARMPVHAATVGLVLVLLALTAFSVTTAVRNAEIAGRAEASAVLSDLSEHAERAVVEQEELVDELAVEPDDETRAELDDARRDVRQALAQIAQDGSPALREQVSRWSLLHDRYERVAEQLLVVAARDPGAADAYETLHVDEPFDQLTSDLSAEVGRRYDRANEALADLGRSQRLLLVVTPIVFGLGLALLAFFSVVLARGRRLLMAQAEENSWQATHDALTGLPNRTLLRSRGAEALLFARSGTGAVTLLLIDLDRFKQINDTLGHRYGDLVLQAIATRLLDDLPPGATVARLGGDEFAVLLPDVSDVPSALTAARHLQRTVQVSTDVDGVTLDVDASIGVALSGQHGEDVEALLKHADIAMYRAKDLGLGVCVYDAELDNHSAEQLGLLGELRRAIDNGELVLHYQPKIRLDDGQCHGVEALVRWQHPERGLVPPALFIPAAESTALIHPLTVYVLDAALAQARQWHDQGRHLQIAVNISARNLLRDGFVADVQALLEHRRVPAAALELEVTESTIMADPERAQIILSQLAALGITLSIDDFGAGYTCLAHLSTLPVHQLKIDRSLVSRIRVDAGDGLIVRSIIELGHSLGLHVIAEGVEDAATVTHLRDLGCGSVQGYHYSPPLPATELTQWWDTTAHASGSPSAHVPSPRRESVPLGRARPSTAHAGDAM